ncbi:hypothetical protein [Aeromonas sp. DNP9]|uniref:hypothetical protein n=1 Tax=Aeromonas sp. DNP9 TaxID=1535548 RepID=UPI001112C92B|nr:hypothetical protein [Aeromonas sp. DNP9]
MKRFEKTQYYISNGFVKTPTNNSGLSTDVLVKGTTVVRIGDDNSYHHFADGVCGGFFKSNHLVCISSHQTPLGVPHSQGSTGHEYTVTEMELLSELTDAEALQYNNWIIPTVKDVIAGKTPSSDPFGMLSITIELIHYAKKNNLKLDLIQPKNVMKRGSVWVHIDPFAF